MTGKNIMRSLIASGVVSLLAASTAVSAADSTQWLQRQLSTTHQDADLQAGAQGRPGETMDAPGDGHAYSAAWLARQLSTVHADAQAEEGARGRAGELLDARAPNGHEFAAHWLQRQLSTEHRDTLM